MSNLSEMLKELMREKNLDQKTFARDIGISESRITDYIHNEKLPTVENLIKMADYFHCSTDLLLGRKYESTHENFNPPAPIAERIVYLTKYFGYTPKRIFAESDIKKSRYYQWINGERKPSLDNLIKFADLFDCSVDFVLGREN